MNFVDAAYVAESEGARSMAVAAVGDVAQPRRSVGSPVGNRIVAYLRSNGSASVDELLHVVAPSAFDDVMRSLDGLREIGFVDVIGRSRQGRLRLTPRGEALSQLIV